MENPNDKILHNILKAVQSVQENAATKQDIHDILETVNFIKDNAVTKTEFNSAMIGVEKRFIGAESRMDKLETKIDDKFNEVMNHVDGFAKLHETLDQELVSLRGKYDRLEERLVRVEQKLGFATV